MPPPCSVCLTMRFHANAVSDNGFGTLRKVHRHNALTADTISCVVGKLACYSNEVLELDSNVVLEQHSKLALELGSKSEPEQHSKSEPGLGSKLVLAAGKLEPEQDSKLEPEQDSRLVPEQDSNLELALGNSFALEHMICRHEACNS